MAGIRLGGVAELPPPGLDHAMIWNVRQASGGTDRLFGIGVPGSDLADYPSQSRVNTNQWTLERPVLSPDLSEYVYVRVDAGAAGTNRTAVMICATDDLSAPAVIAETPSSGSAVEGRTIEILGWSLDGQQVYYRGVTATPQPFSPAEIRKVNRDGTGDTQIWTDLNIFPSFFGYYPRISPDGTMFAFWLDFGATGSGRQGLWVMNEDGTGVNHIYTCPDSGGEEPDDFYGWSPDSEWLLFRDTNWTPSPREEGIYKIRPDGTDLTTIALPTTSDPGINLSQGQHSLWLTDASGIVCAKDNAGDFEVGILLADGSETFTPFSPTRVLDYGAFYADGPVMNSDYLRAYWYVGGGAGVGNMQVVSAKIDGSDYRVDDDALTPATHDDYLEIGFYKRSS